MKRSFFLLGIGLAGFLSLAAVTKKPNAILDTQADPVSYQEIQKEETEGKKGPPVPSMNLFPKQNFMTDGSVEEPKEDSVAPLIEEDADLDLWLEEDPSAGEPSLTP